MRAAALRILPALMSAFLLSCQQQVDWITYRGENGAGYTSNSLFPPLGLRWKLPLQDKPDRYKTFNPPVVKGDVIYFGSLDGNFYALDVNSGYMRWSYAAKNAVNSVPFADDERVYFGANDGNVYAVSKDEGKLAWMFAAETPVQSTILRYNNSIIFTSDTGAMYFLDMNGRETHRVPNPVWSHHTFQVFDGILYWAPEGRRFGAYDIANKNFLWMVDTNSPYAIWYSFAALDQTAIYYASAFYKYTSVELTYYALDRKTGQVIWQEKDDLDQGKHVPFSQHNAFMRHVQLLDYMAPALYNDIVVYTSGDALVRAYHRKTGKQVWLRKFDWPTSSAPTIAGDRVYFGVYGDEQMGPKKTGRGPRLICLSASDGNILWEMETEGAVLNAPVVSGKRMLFGTDRNLFYVLEEIF